MGLTTTITMALATTGASGGRMLMYSGTIITADSTMILAGAGLGAVRRVDSTGGFMGAAGLVMAGAADMEGGTEEADMADNGPTSKIFQL